MCRNSFGLRICILALEKSLGVRTALFRVSVIRPRIKRKFTVNDDNVNHNFQISEISRLALHRLTFD